MDLDYRDKQYSLILRTLEFIGCTVCLTVAALLIYYQIYYAKEPEPKLTYPILFVLFTPSIIFTMVTFYDLIYYFRLKPVFSHFTWWPLATLAMVLFFATAGLVIYTRKRFAEIEINIALAFTIITGIIFLFDIILMIYGYYTKYVKPFHEQDRTRREYIDTKILPAAAPRRSIHTMQRPAEFEKCPPCSYRCEKTTSYHNVPVKKSSAMIQRRESKRAFGDERIVYPSVHVTQAHARTEEKYTQSSKTAVCNCETKSGNCQQCKWIKYLVEAQMTRERRGSNVLPVRNVPYETESESPVSSGNLLKPVVYQEQLTVKNPSKKVPSQNKERHSIREVESKQSIHNLQNTEIVKTYIQQQNIAPRISKREVSKQNSIRSIREASKHISIRSMREASKQTSIRSIRKPSYQQVTSVIVRREPSTVKENKYTQSNLISAPKDQQTNTSRQSFQTGRPRRTSSQEEVAIQVIDYEQRNLEKISEVSIETVTKSDANNPGIPKIYVSDDADSDNSKRITSTASSSAPCKQTQYSNDTKCACAHKSTLEDAICVHCLRQWRIYQSTKSSDNEPSPPITNEKRNGLDNSAGFTEQVSKGVQIRQASALFQYISTKPSASTSTSQPYSRMGIQPAQPDARRLDAPSRNLRSSSRSEPPKVVCMCNENEGHCCKMHGTKNKVISLPASASRRNDGKNVPKMNHSTQIRRKDRYKTSP